MGVAKKGSRRLTDLTDFLFLFSSRSDMMTRRDVAAVTVTPVVARVVSSRASSDAARKSRSQAPDMR